MFTRRRVDRTSIAFQAYSIHLAQFYLPLIKRLLRDKDRYKVVFQILLHPHFPLKSAYELKRFAAQVLGVSRKNIKFYWQTFWESYDLVVCADIFARFPLRAARTCLLLHGPGLTTRMFSRSLLRKSLFDFDRAFVNGRYDYQLVRTRCQFNKTNTQVIDVGLPFLDDLSDQVAASEGYAQRLLLDPNKRTILVAPSWRGLRIAAAKGRTYFEDVISALKGLKYNLIVKPHVCSFNRVMAGGVKWRKEFEKIPQQGWAVLDTDVDDRPALNFADVLITDISSRAFVFMLLGKPVVHYFPAIGALDELDRQRLKLLRQGSLTVSSPCEIPDVLGVIETKGYRNQFAAEVAAQCFSNFGKSTEIFLKVIKEWLGKKSDF